MVNQRYHRTYVDCQEFGAKTPCCPDCLSGKHSMLEAPIEKRIYVKPPALDGANVDWTLNIEGVVCCTHHHHTFIGREGWMGLVEKFQATPFYTDQKDTTYKFDDNGSVSVISGPPVKVDKRSNGERKVERKKTDSGPAPIACMICTRMKPRYGKCSYCFPDQP